MINLDQQWMDRALALARQGIGLASPNPTVGCVLVNANNSRSAKASINTTFSTTRKWSLSKSRPAGKTATAYVTLEPCSHTGRTGPCADALIAAQVARVVIATLDANPMVRGNGVARLRSAGIEVDIGIGEHEAQQLNNAFREIHLHWPALGDA